MMVESAAASKAEGDIHGKLQRHGSISSINDLPLEDGTRQKLDGSKELNVLVIGRYQVGKSTLINSLFFEKGNKYVKRTQEGSMEATAVDVTPYTLEWKGISYI